MDNSQRHIAVARGEAWAASLLASAALQTLFLMTATSPEILEKIDAYINDILNMSGPGNGNPDDEFNAQMRETARFQVTQILDGIRRGSSTPPRAN